MLISIVTVASLTVLAHGLPNEHQKRTSYPSEPLLTDLSAISRSWGQISTYADNAENYFGVQDVGLPDGCAIEQAHSLQRHAQRFPTAFYDDGLNGMPRFCIPSRAQAKEAIFDIMDIGIKCTQETDSKPGNDFSSL